MSEKKGKLALYWAASCGGCEISLLAVNEKILDIAAAFDIVLWPVAVDGKVRDIERMDDDSIDVCLFNGAIRTSEQEYMAQLLRRKSKVLVAFGSCSHEGGIPALANMNTKEEIFKNSYEDTASTENPSKTYPQPETQVPEGTLHLPVFYETVRSLDQVVPVEYYLPGCPPEAERIWDAVVAILEGKLPAAGATIGSDTTVCDTCKRKRSEKKIKKFLRTWEVIPDEETCLLEQGILCCGLATRAGCDARCPTVNSPCIGCYGPNDGVDDYGARLMAAVASVIDSDKPEEIDRIIQEGIPDPIGSFYRFSMAHSLLRRKKMA
jgi:F420-non-reducing hydrogenase small subunit